MEAFHFGLKDFFISILFFFSACQGSEPASFMEKDGTQAPGLTMPKDNDAENYDAVATKLTLILLANDRIYGYEGNDLNNGALYEKQTIQKAIRQSQKKFSGKDFVVLIKPTDKASYAATVNVLDEMSICNIKKYVLVDLNEKDKQFIKSSFL